VTQDSGQDAVAMAQRRNRGRPSRYRQKIADEICRRLADGEGLKEICRTPGMPHESTVRAWALSNYQGFTAQYERARAIQFERWADEILSIADDSRQDTVVRQLPDGSTERVINHEHINRSRLRIDSRKWLLSKLLPSRFGDRVSAELTGADGGPIRFESVFGPLTELAPDEMAMLQIVLRRRAGVTNDEDAEDGDSA
jgi:hypothetical protein